MTTATMVACKCRAETFRFNMTAIVRAATIHTPEGCRPFDSAAYTAYLGGFEDYDDALSPVEWARLQLIHPQGVTTVGDQA